MEEVAIHIISLLLIFLFLMLSGFFSFTEMAIASSNEINLRTKAKESKGKERKKINKAAQLIDDYNETVTAIVVFNNIFNVLSTTLATTYLSWIFTSNGNSNPGIAFTISFISMTILIIVFGELLPKMLARKYPEQGLLKITPIAAVAISSLKPITILFKKFIKQEKKSLLKSKNELKHAITEIANFKHITDIEKTILQRSLELRNTKVFTTYIKMENVFTINSNITQNELIQQMKNNKFTRVPVYSNKKIIGVLNTKSYTLDLVNRKKIKFNEHINDVIFFKKSSVLADVFLELRTRRQHLGIIVDNKGKHIGIITVEDIVEHIFGKIYDEDDIEKDGVYKIDSNRYIVNKNVNVTLFFETYLSRKAPINQNKSEDFTFLNWVDKGNDSYSNQNYFVYKNIIIWKRKDVVNKNDFVYEIDII